MNNKNGTVIIQLEAGGPATTGTSVPKRKTESATNSNKAQRNVKVMSGNNIVESATLQYDTQRVFKKQHMRKHLIQVKSEMLQTQN